MIFLLLFYINLKWVFFKMLILIMGCCISGLKDSKGFPLKQVREAAKLFQILTFVK